MPVNTRNVWRQVKTDPSTGNDCFEQRLHVASCGKTKAGRSTAGCCHDECVQNVIRRSLLLPRRASSDGPCERQRSRGATSPIEGVARDPRAAQPLEVVGGTPRARRARTPAVPCASSDRARGVGDRARRVRVATTAAGHRIHYRCGMTIQFELQRLTPAAPITRTRMPHSRQPHSTGQKRARR
jgi:hypothetical protein